jgi:hypothetical protein
MEAANQKLGDPAYHAAGSPFGPFGWNAEIDDEQKCGSAVRSYGLRWSDSGRRILVGA